MVTFIVGSSKIIDSCPIFLARSTGIIDPCTTIVVRSIEIIDPSSGSTSMSDDDRAPIPRLGAGLAPGEAENKSTTFAYGRAQLLAVRDRLDGDAARGVTETIRCSLPARLSRLIRHRCRPKQPLHDANGTDGPPPQLSGSHDTWRPELHQEPAPPPSERACDAGERISVRVERRPGPWPCGARSPRLAGYGRDSRCLVRPTRLTERQTRQICASDAAPAATTIQPSTSANGAAGRHRSGRRWSSRRPLGLAEHTSPPAAAAAAGCAPARRLGSAGATLRLGHINVRSLMPSMDDVAALLRDERLDMLCISETWLSKNI